MTPTRRFNAVSVQFGSDVTFSILDSITQKICPHPAPETVKHSMYAKTPCSDTRRRFQAIAEKMNSEHYEYVVEIDKFIHEA